MRIGIYNRYLSTLGGGEKHSLAIAEYLSQTHQVDVISHKSTPRERAEAVLNLDLSRINFITIPDQSSLGLSAVSREYDFFINSSYMDFFPALSKYSAALIFFPAKLNFHILIRRKMKQMIRRALQIPDMAAGVQNFEMLDSGLRWDLDTAARFELPAWHSPYRAAFNLESLDPRLTGVQVQLDGQVVEDFRFSAPGTKTRCEIRIPPTSGRGGVLTIHALDGVSPDGTPKMSLDSLSLDLPMHRFYLNLFEHRLKGWAIRFQYNPPAYALIDYMKSYNAIWANSEFTRRWIRTYWRLDSEVLYPLVDVERLVPGPKSHKILNVGRFFAGNHNKKHLEMVKAFRQMVDEGLKDWELHLVGGASPEEIHQNYFCAVQQAAAGYPIFLHPNFPYPELVSLYAESAIYWHASGYGEDENRNPDRFEHFGITTVEAMASGCCPVVIAKGGQPEIVSHEKDGFLWKTLEELKQYSLRLIQDPALRQTMSARAVQTSTRFGRSQFQTQLAHSLNNFVK